MILINHCDEKIRDGRKSEPGLLDGAVFFPEFSCGLLTGELKCKKRPEMKNSIGGGSAGRKVGGDL